MNDELNVKELTYAQFYSMTPEEVGFNGTSWNVDAVVVNGLCVLDRYHSVSSRGRTELKRWFEVKFKRVFDD